MSFEFSRPIIRPQRELNMCVCLSQLSRNEIRPFYKLAPSLVENTIGNSEQEPRIFAYWQQYPIFGIYNVQYTEQIQAKA